MGEGNRLADGTASNDASQRKDVKGEGGFLFLPSRQRDLIKQALSEKLPPEYSVADPAILHEHRQGQVGRHAGHRRQEVGVASPS